MSTNKKTIFLIFFFLLTVISLPQLGRADTASDLQNKINQQNKALNDLEAEIASYQQQLSVIGNNKNTLTNAIKTLTLESQKLKAEIAVSQAKISETTTKIQLLGDVIQKTAASIDDLKAAVAKNLREINAEDNRSTSLILVSSKSFSDVWHYAGEQSAFRAGIHEKTLQLASTKEALLENKNKVEQSKNQLLALNSQLLDQKKINQSTQAQKTTLLVSTKNQETAYQKLVAQKLALKNQMEADLRDYESRLKYVLDPSSIPQAGSSPLAWPLDKIVITQLFGKTVAAARLYTTGSHNGVDFGAPIGTPAKALANGTVIDFGNADLSCPGASYGKWIFIKYDNGLASVYGHLSLVKATKGARVSTGDIVAYTGATGYATGPHLHVSIFPNNGVSVNSFPSKSCTGRTITIPTAATNAYLDPMLYFPKQK